MRALSAELRRQLESAVIEGRRAAEAGVRAAMSALGVREREKPAHLSENQAHLRRGLRAKQRQMAGDYEILVWEAAYEQWHKMLFARFLVENGLLRHPEFGAPVTLDDCDELAADLGEPDGWSVAARFAAEILPGIFRLEDPCVRLRLAPEHRIALEKVVAGLPAAIFAADDSLGWVYQYWQSERKDQVNASEVKIGGADLGPVTQLFTENYMVRFLLENSLGAWWAARHHDSPLVQEFEYLRFDDAGEPAAGRFEGWPGRVAEVTVMDPCCGSGHFLVEAFGMLWRMRAEEEGLNPVNAQDAVLRDNLFGLELDPRCVQIAMFAVALAAWRHGGGWRELPTPHIACSGIPVRAPLNEWVALAQGDGRLERALQRLHILFKDADTLGSLIDPRLAAESSSGGGPQRSLDDINFEDIAPLLEKATSREAADPATAVLGADAGGILRAAVLLSRHYTLVATNVPYLGRTKQGQTLSTYIDTQLDLGSVDLAIAMLDRQQRFATSGGSVAAVSPQAWLFLRSYQHFRKRALRRSQLALVARLGSGAFDQISGAVVNVCLSIMNAAQPVEWVLRLIDAEAAVGARGKAQALSTRTIRRIPQASQLRNPMAMISGLDLEAAELVGQLATSYQGLSTGDAPRLIRQFWEITTKSPATAKWRRLQGTTDVTVKFGGRSNLVWWEDSGVGLAALRGREAWDQRGVSLSQMGTMPVTLYTGDLFDNSSTAVIPRRSEDALALYCFFGSSDFREALRLVSPKVSVEVATVQLVAVDIDHWRRIAAERFPDGFPEPSSDDPTQWLFTGRPEISTEPLQVAVSRLVGFEWPEQPPSDHLSGCADYDGIVCLPAVGGELPAAERVRALLMQAYGSRWSPTLIRRLVEQTGSKKGLAEWLRDDFFSQHCKVFGNRPFVWHVWDGRKDGFSALLNYHRLDRAGLEKLTYTYLGDWIERQRSDATDDIAGADLRLGSAEELKRKLEAILKGDPPYDIYVRWKELHEQPIGWEPDLNDGVRVNIRPFVEAGVLRSKVNIHWRKDRGKNPNGSERHNDRHHTIAEKQQARDKARQA